MKKIYHILSIVLFACLWTGMNAAPNSQELGRMWDRANTLYINADYHEAIAVYDSIANSGYTSTKLYYNLANAYFKDGQNGKAIVYYNKALILSPSDADARYNLEVANSYVKDDIAEVPAFFLTKWIRSMRQMFSSNTWAVISLAAMFFALCGVLMYLLPLKRTIRKTGFFGGITMFLIFAVSVIFSTIEKRELTDSSHAIIINSAVSVKSSPDKSSTDIFILHEGTKVKVTNTFGEWSEILVSNGSKGWLMNSSMESI